MAGTKVGVQCVQTTLCRMTSAQVGIDIGTTKGIDGLLGVADQEQTAFGCVLFNFVDGLKDAVLHRVGVLKLVDQRHWELLTNQGRQPFAALRL